MKSNNLSQFQRFIKPKKENVQSGNEVWLYTRVSTKDQYENYSLDVQKKAAIEYAKTHNYILTKTFGDTYESASDDMSRKEFSRLIMEVKKARKKPFAIMIYKANRFSRTGSGGIKLLHDLIYAQGVHLIEVISGLSSYSQREELNFMTRLIKAKEENLDRLEVTLPAMKEYLKKGNWLGNVPKGYTQYGPRVKDAERLSGTHRIVMNGEGKHLKKAWKLKSEGYTDAEIIRELAQNDYFIRFQRLSKMWTNPFYCGVCVNRLLEKPVKGNWEPMVTIEEFARINEKVMENRPGYKIERESADRPLMGTLVCPDCGKKMTGYIVHSKGLHYYCCHYCKGVTINANTTPSAKGKGAHELFVELLQSFEFEDKYFQLIALQIDKLIDHSNNKSERTEKSLLEQIEILQKKKEVLEKRFVLDGEITKSQYEKFSKGLDDEIAELIIKKDSGIARISNQKEKIKKALMLARNLNKIWVDEPVRTKRRLQNLLFPNGLVLNTKTRSFLTDNMNSFFLLISTLLGNCDKKEKGLIDIKTIKSHPVAGRGLEPLTFGL